MKPLLKSLKLNRYDFYETHLSIVNCILPINMRMTKMEIKVLSRFMSFEGDISKERFGETARRLVKVDLTISAGGLSNYMRAFKEKGVLNDSGEIKAVYFPTSHEQTYNIKLTMLDETNN